MLAAAAEGDPAAAVDDDLRRGVVAHLGRLVHDDRDRVAAAVEGDRPALRDRLAERRTVQLAGVPWPTTCRVGARCATGVTAFSWAYDGTGVSNAVTRPPSRTIERGAGTPLTLERIWQFMARHDTP